MRQAMGDYIDRQLLQELKQFALDHGARWARIDQKCPAIVGGDQSGRPFRLVVDGMANEWRHALKQFARKAEADECAGLKRFLRISPADYSSAA